MPKQLTRNSPQQLIKLTSIEKYQIAHWVGEFKKDKEILELFQDKFGREISQSTVSKLRHHPDLQDIIRKDREKYDSQLYQVDYAWKRRRVERLTQIIDRNFDKGNDDRALKGLHEVYEQIEKPKGFGNQNNYQFNIYREMTDEEFDMRELELLNKRRQLKEVLNVVPNEQKEGAPAISEKFGT